MPERDLGCPLYARKQPSLSLAADPCTLKYDSIDCGLERGKSSGVEWRFRTQQRNMAPGYGVSAPSESMTRRTISVQPRENPRELSGLGDTRRRIGATIVPSECMLGHSRWTKSSFSRYARSWASSEALTDPEPLV